MFTRSETGFKLIVKTWYLGGDYAIKIKLRIAHVRACKEIHCYEYLTVFVDRRMHDL